MKRDRLHLNSMIKTEGITLVALVVTIVVLLILAGITLVYVFGDNGLFGKARDAKEQTEIAKAREKLEMILSGASIEKYTNKAYNANEYLNGYILSRIDVDIEDDIVTVDNCSFLIDRNIPAILNYEGHPNGIVIKCKVIGNDWTKENPSIEVEIEIKDNSGLLNTSSIRVSENGDDITNTIDVSNGSFTLTTNKSTKYIINVNNSKGELITKEIEVQAKVDNTAPTLEQLGVTVEGMDIKINAKAIDNQSGLKQFHYTITPTEGIEEGQEKGTFVEEQTLTIKTTKATTYTISVMAEDKVGNISTARIAEVRTKSGLTLEKAKEKVNASTLQQYIGQEVDYSPEAGGTWRIFYYDEEGYFGTTNTLYLKRDYDERAKSSLYIDAVTAEGTEMMKRMNPKWRDYPTENANIVDKTNEKCVAWICDPGNWEDYKTTEVSFAIGSPSIEMYMMAYNVWKQNNPKGDALVNKVGTSTGGYLIGSGESYGSETSENIIERGPNEVFVTSNKVGWVASPIDYYTGRVYLLNGSKSSIQLGDWNQNYYMSPIVAINP